MSLNRLINFGGITQFSSKVSSAFLQNSFKINHAASISTSAVCKEKSNAIVSKGATSILPNQSTKNPWIPIKDPAGTNQTYWFNPETNETTR